MSQRANQISKLCIKDIYLKVQVQTHLTSEVMTLTKVKRKMCSESEARYYIFKYLVILTLSMDLGFYFDLVSEDFTG